jgi:uroporphyrin-III C-methyltransferase
MGLAGAAPIAEKLMADGLAPDTPVAVVERATQANERLVTSLLADLAGLVAREAIASPALIIVGDVAALPAARAKAKETACLVC